MTILNYGHVAEREAINVAERAERKLQLRDKVGLFDYLLYVETIVGVCRLNGLSFMRMDVEKERGNGEVGEGETG